MINKITIENFQGHKQNTLDFSPGLNVIIGPSGVGKSSIIRALKYIFFNVPKGVSFLRRPDGDKVILTLEASNYILKRIRNKNTNEIYLNDQKWVDFSTEIPELIVNTTNIRPVFVDEDLSFNLQFTSQIDPHEPFLLAESDSLRAKFLNRLSGSHIIDIVLRDLSQDLKKESNEVGRLEESIATIQTELNKYNNLDAKQDAIEYLESSYNQLQKDNTQKDLLIGLKQKLDFWQRQKQQLEKYKYLFSRIDIVQFSLKIDLLNKLRSLKGRINGLDSLISDIHNKQRVINKIRNIDLSGAFNLKETLNQNKLILQKIQKLRGESLILNNAINNISNQRKIVVNSISFVEKQYNQLLEEAKAKNICPMCKRPL